MPLTQQDLTNIKETIIEAVIDDRLTALHIKVAVFQKMTARLSPKMRAETQFYKQFFEARLQNTYAEILLLAQILNVTLPKINQPDSLKT